jgi:hypothetical protein
MTHRLAQLTFVALAIGFIMAKPLPLIQMVSGAVTPNGGIPVSGQYNAADIVMAGVWIITTYASFIWMWFANRNRNRRIRRQATVTKA